MSIKTCLLIFMLFLDSANASTNEASAIKKTYLPEFKVNPDLPSSLLEKKDSPCFGYEDVSYDSCNGRGKYYIGYGLEALSSKFLNNYLSSYDINSSYVCFKNKDTSLLLKRILFVWYSQLEIPKKIALYGVQKNGKQDTEILLRNIDIKQFDEINGNVFSNINLNLEKSYERYVVRTLEGGMQNRLIIRSIIPSFSNNKETDDSLLLLASSISKKMTYGNGVHREDIIQAGIICEKTAIRDYILSSKSAHCGNFSYIFAHDVSSLYGITSIGLRSPTGAIHNIVEVYNGDEYKTVDPTLGLLYPCPVASLVDGSCDYKSARLLTQINPIFRGYCGINFFYNAAILSKKFNIEQMKGSYCE